MTKADLIHIIRQGFKDGLGVEDIANRHGVPVDDLRAEVKQLRDDGIIADLIYGGEQ